MKKSVTLSIMSALIFLGAAGTISSAAELSTGERVLGKSSSKNMRVAFLGNPKDNSYLSDGKKDKKDDEVGVDGGETASASTGTSGVGVAGSTVARVALNNTTISTPYSYKAK